MAQEEEVGKEGKKRESEKKESRGSSEALRLPRPKRETAIWHLEIDGIKKNQESRKIYAKQMQQDCECGNAQTVNERGMCIGKITERTEDF
mgnify:CR=1 FL=1